MKAVAALLWPRGRSVVNRWQRASGAERTTYIVFASLFAVFWAGIFLLFGWLVNAFYGVEIFGPLLARKLLEILLLGLFALLCFSNVVTALSTFYLSDDLDLLLSLPLRRETFHTARQIDTTVQSSWMMVVFGLPVFVAYGYAYGAGLSYYLLLAIVAPALVVLAASIGIGLASVLVNIFPARRLREGLALAGILAMGFVLVFLRLLRPERLVNADNFQSVAAYVADMQTPVPVLLPPRWASDVLTAALGGRPLPWMELGLLLTGAVACSGLARWLTAWLYDTGRARAQEARSARLAKAGWLDTVLALYTRPLPPALRAVVVKDIKTFVRDPSQWTQVLLVGSIILITLASIAALPLDAFKGPYVGLSRNGLAFLVLGLVGFVMAAVAARFQFTAVSAEGRSFWFIRTAPIQARTYLWAKTWPFLPAVVLVGEILAVVSTVILGAGPFLTGLAVWTAFWLGLGISGIAVGMGAVFADFKLDNVARAAQGPAGVMFMVVALCLVGVVLGLEVAPVWLVLQSWLQERSLLPWELVVIALCLVSVGLVCGVSMVVSVRIGAARLWARELPNS
ncbi:MAG: hypothetical protein GXP62_18170 [Oligoflexia bacterium]|nr:hypothetical protein [Oligoflexia bacterium]